MSGTEGGGPLSGDEVARANRALEASDYLTAHDLETPLPIVLGFLELMDTVHAPSCEPHVDEGAQRRRR